MGIDGKGHEWDAVDYGKEEDTGREFTIFKCFVCELKEKRYLKAK